MPAARQEIAVAAYNGKIFVIGGYDEAGTSTGTVQVYDPATDTWDEAASLPIANNHGAAAVAGGTLYAFGGLSNRAFAYDASEDQWVDVAPMRYEHGGTAAVAVIDNRIYVAGGVGAEMVGNELEVYDPAADRWTTLAPMAVPRNHIAGGAINGKFYVVGGRGDPGARTALEVYDPASNQWTTLSPMPTGRSGIAAGVVGGRLYVFGGEIPRLFGEVEVYDPSTDKWEQLPPMPTPRHGIWAGVIGSSIYLPGGATEQGLGATTVNEVFSVLPTIFEATVRKKRLIVTGQNFSEGAVILVDGEPQRTRNAANAPDTRLVSKKAGRQIDRGETVTLQVVNADGTASPEFEYTRP
jgi:N-acetylneuraminic acid mutarotase